MAKILEYSFLHSLISTGAFNNGGYLKFYEAGTSTPLVVYSDNSRSTSLGSTVDLNSLGQPETSGGTAVSIYLASDDYKIEVYDSADNLLKTIDNYDANDISVATTTTRSAGFTTGHTTIADSHIMGPILIDQSLTLPSGATNSEAAAITAATAETVFTIKKNNASVGTITVAAAGATGTFSVASPVSLSAGDYVHIEGPSTADVTLRYFGVTLQFTV